jgi:hypothetical protein
MNKTMIGVSPALTLHHSHRICATGGFGPLEPGGGELLTGSDHRYDHSEGGS